MHKMTENSGSSYKSSNGQKKFIIYAIYTKALGRKAESRVKNIYRFSLREDDE